MRDASHASGSDFPARRLRDLFACQASQASRPPVSCNQCPACWKRSGSSRTPWSARCAAQLKRIERFKRLVAKRRPRLIVLAARGTSDNAAQFGRYLLEITTGIPVSLAAPSIYTLYNARIDFRDALVVAISQSGESTDTNLVLSHARKQGALTIGITNEASSTLAKLAEHVFLVRAGKEKSVAATKTYTGQVLMLYLLAYALGGKHPSRRSGARLPERVHLALQLEPKSPRSPSAIGSWIMRSSWAAA